MKNNMKPWLDKTQKLNTGKHIKLGIRIMDCYGNEGKIIDFMVGTTVEDHGSIHIQADDGKEESLCYFNWEKKLRILD